MLEDWTVLKSHEDEKGQHNIPQVAAIQCVDGKDQLEELLKALSFDDVELPTMECEHHLLVEVSDLFALHS